MLRHPGRRRLPDKNDSYSPIHGINNWRCLFLSRAANPEVDSMGRGRREAAHTLVSIGWRYSLMKGKRDQVYILNVSNYI